MYASVAGSLQPQATAEQALCKFNHTQDTEVPTEIHKSTGTGYSVKHTRTLDFLPPSPC